MAIPALAQDARGRVQGTVVDPSGGHVPGVAVTLANDATGIAVTRHSGAGGRYIFDQVDPGTYTVTAQITGFATHVHKNVRVPQRGDVTVSIALKVAAMEEMVTVEVSPVSVQFNTATRDLTIEKEVIGQLPIATRNPATLATYDPSVNGDFNRNSNIDHYAGNAYDIGGESKGKNDVLIDGSPLANSAKLGYNPPIDTVEEYTVMQNAVDAEYGHTAGGIVTIAMKAGTNELHGSAYYYGGDPDWNATTNRVTGAHSQNTFWNGGATVGLPIIKNKLFLFSAFEKQTDTNFASRTMTLPTDLERMGDFSQSLWTNGGQRVIYDPATSRIVNGRVVRDPFPGNVIPADRFDPLAVQLLGNLWDPNNAGRDLTGRDNFVGDYYRYYRYWNLSNRLDWQINDRWRAYGRVSIFRTDQPDSDFTNGVDQLKMRYNEGSQRDGTNFVFDTVYTVNPSTTLSVNAAYYKTIDRRNYPEFGIGDDGYADLWPSRWYEPYMPGRPIVYFPNIQVPSGDTFGVRNFWWQQPWGSSLSAKLTKHFSKHSVKLGANVRWKRGDAARFFFTNLIFTGQQTQNTTSGANSATGHPWADFLLGVLDPDTAVSGLASSTQFIPLQEANTEMYAVYLQDDFRVNEKLTVQLGLRYEYEGGYYDTNHMLPQRLDLNDPIPGMQQDIEPILASTPAGNTGKTISQLMAESAGQGSHLYNGAFYYTSDGSRRATSSDSLQLMPRIGLAYRVDDKTAVRVGYGRFYTPPALTDSGNEPLGQFNLGSGFAPITPSLPLVEGRPQAFLEDPFPQGLTPVLGNAYGRYTSLGDGVSIYEYERRPPISDRINLSVQREIWGRTVVDVTYLMNFTNRYLLNVGLNNMDPRLSYQYGAELNRAVANPFYNYGTEETFPGQLRRQPTVSVAQLLRPYPQYQAITQTSSDVGARYRFQSLQVRLQRPYSKGFAYMVSYAYNHEKSEQYFDAVDEYDGVLTWQNGINPRHRLIVTATAELPFGHGRKYGSDWGKPLDLLLGGWDLSGTFWYRSGQFLRFGTMQAPGSVTQLGGTGDDEFWFDTTGFANQPAFTRRSNPWQYDDLTGPSFKTLDLAIGKQFRVTRGSTLQLRLEAYNALNQIVWGNPNLSVTSSDFGRVTTQANQGRRLQYAFRFQF